MAEDFDHAHDQARYAYEGRTNYGLRRAENGGICMDEAHHSDGWEAGFRDGWEAAAGQATLARIDELEKCAASFRSFWNEWGDVNDVAAAEALEARVRQLTADAERIVECPACGSRLASALPAVLKHHDDGSHEFVPLSPNTGREP